MIYAIIENLLVAQIRRGYWKVYKEIGMPEFSKRIREVSISPTLGISSRVKRMKKAGVDVIGFGAGEPDFDTPQNIKTAAIDSINKGFTKYTPTSGIDELKEAVVEKFKKDNGIVYEKKDVLIGCGAKHILYNIFQAVCNPGDEVIIIKPYWVSYPEIIKLAGGIPVVVDTIEEEGFVPKPEAIGRAITPKTKAIIINSPNNPTGAVYPEDIIREIADICVKNDILVVTDEVYEKIIYGNNRHISIASFNDEIKKRTITVNAVSKTYSMTGWRIGYAAGPSEIISAMAKIQDHSTSNPTSISQMAAVSALIGPQDAIIKMKEEFTRRRDFVVERCQRISGISFVPPQGAFYIFINISSTFGREIGGEVINNSIDFAEVLLDEAEVAVVPGIAFGDDRYIRITFATSPREIAQGLDRIEKFLT